MILTSSFKKNNNAQGVPSRGAAGPVNPSDSNTASGARSLQNGGHVHSTLHGAFILNKGRSTSLAFFCSYLPPLPHILFLFAVDS